MTDLTGRMPDPAGNPDHTTAGAYAGEDVRRLGARTDLEQRTYTSEIRGPGLRAAVDRHDRSRWGPIWAGALTAVATYLLLELVLLATDLLDRDLGQADGLPDGSLLTIAAAAIAFLLGGLVAGAMMHSKAADDGLLHGIVTWAVGIVLFLLIVLFSTGLAMGTLGHAGERVFSGEERQAEAEGGTAQADDEDAQESAGTAAGMLGATLAAAAIGGLVGSKLWPRHGRSEPGGLRDADDHR